MTDRERTELSEIARRMRIHIIRMISRAASGHPGGSLSAVEILATLYFREMRIDPKRPELPDRDRFVLSKGHAAPVLYAALAERGFFPPELLDGLRQSDLQPAGPPAPAGHARRRRLHRLAGPGPVHGQRHGHGPAPRRKARRACSPSSATASRRKARFGKRP